MSVSASEFETFAARMREAVAAVREIAPSSAHEVRESAPAGEPALAEPTSKQPLADYVFGTDRPRPRPPFDATALLSGMGLDRALDTAARNVTADVKAQLAAERAAQRR